jgi:hypothetical protein
MIKGKFHGFIALAAFLCLSVFICPESHAQTEQIVRFVVFSDAQPADDEGKASGLMPEMFKNVRDEIELLQPDFAIFCGNLLAGPMKAKELEAAWKDYLKDFGKSSVEIYYAPGYTDVWDATSRAAYRKYSGPTRQSFIYGNYQFILLDACDDFAGSQKSWLEGSLSEHEDLSGRFVFIHWAFWSKVREVAGVKLPVRPKRLPRWNWDADVQPLLARHEASAVFAGGQRRYLKDDLRDGVNYFLVGASGAEAIVPEEVGGFPNYLWVTAKPSGYRVSVIEPGKIVPDDVVTDEKVARRTSVARSLRNSQVKTVDGRRQIVMPLENQYKEDVSVYIEWDRPFGWQIEPSSVEIKVPSGEEKDAKFEVVEITGPERRSPGYRFEVRTGKPPEILLHGSAKLRNDKEADAHWLTPTLDGELGEWAGKSHIDITGEDLVALKADGDLLEKAKTLSARGWFAHDPNALYLAVRVKTGGSEPKKNPDKPWEGDCIEWFIDAREAGKSGVARSSCEVFHAYFPAPLEAGPVKAVLSKPSALEGNFSAYGKPTKDGYVIEAKFSLRDILGMTNYPADFYYGDVGIYATHEGKPFVRLMWNADVDADHNNSLFGRIVFR